MTRGHESLVDIQSPTWDMVSHHLECLEIPGNLVITSSPVDKAHSLSLGLSMLGSHLRDYSFNGLSQFFSLLPYLIISDFKL